MLGLHKLQPWSGALVGVGACILRSSRLAKDSNFGRLTFASRGVEQIVFTHTKMADQKPPDPGTCAPCPHLFFFEVVACFMLGLVCLGLL